MKEPSIEQLLSSEKWSINKINRWIKAIVTLPPKMADFKASLTAYERLIEVYISEL